MNDPFAHLTRKLKYSYNVTLCFRMCFHSVFTRFLGCEDREFQ